MSVRVKVRVKVRVTGLGFRNRVWRIYIYTNRVVHTVEIRVCCRMITSGCYHLVWRHKIVRIAESIGYHNHSIVRRSFTRLGGLSRYLTLR